MCMKPVWLENSRADYTFEITKLAYITAKIFELHQQLYIKELQTNIQ